ncbi:hypothetical protein I317_01779 [Kwoniella heveanensis CBS 569]|nr:hypothetical protein I317_01779 [Kwoniella heveanensis CBS 569]
MSAEPGPSSQPMAFPSPEQDGKGQVQSHDYAEPDPLPKKTVETPQTKEEWDSFITRYTMGEYVKCNFNARDLPSPSPGPSLSSSNVPPPALERPAPVPQPTPVTSGETVKQLDESSFQTPTPSRHNSSHSGPSSDDNADFHPDTSLSGPSNQDPEIPNIAAEDLPESSGSAQSVPRRKYRADKSKTYKSQEAMTMDNMRQLGVEQQGDRARERDERPGESRSLKGKGRRRRDHAELASVGRTMSADSSEDDEAVAPWPGTARRRKPRRPRSRGSWTLRSRSPDGSLARRDTAPSLDLGLFESGTNSSTSASAVDINYDHAEERARVRQYFENHGYLPAPRQPPEIMRRRLRVIRRLGLEEIDPLHRETLDRFTRLAISVFKTRSAVISVIGKDKQTYLSEIGLGKKSGGLDVSFCSHAVMSSETDHKCTVVNNAAEDWRFRNNPYVKQGTGPIQFYAGAPLRVGSGTKGTIIGTLCITDDKPRQFSDDDQDLLADLADCVVSELELIYSQQASVDSAKLHQISVDFLRRSLKHRPNERAGQSQTRGTNDTSTGTGTSSATSTTGKRNSGADQNQDQANVDIYDEACREIRYALDAYAVGVVDLSQFHLFYPTYQNSSTGGGGTSTRGGSTSGRSKSQHSGADTARQSAQTGRTASTASSTAHGLMGEEDSSDAYSKPANVKRALPTYAISDPMAPSRTPQLAVLGYSCSSNNFAFNFTSSPTSRKIIADFIASNVKTRRVWYTRDDSEGIAQSITHLMPPGTETSMAMPVFGFDGQVAFAVVACWTDPLYTYPAGALQFVETIAGSLLASVMKERLHQAERAQLNFAAAASHELRTPLHQINAAASLLRTALHGVLEGPHHDGAFVPKISMEDRVEALAQLEIIEANGLSLGNILENIIDTLDIGKMASNIDANATAPVGTPVHPDLLRSNNAKVTDFAEVLESVVDDAMTMEAKARRISSGKGLEGVEVILEVMPRRRGGWKMSSDPGPLARSLGKIIHNAVKFTDRGHVHITVQDISRDVVLPADFDNSIKLSTVSIDIKDTGKGMSTEFLDSEVLRPFSKEDPFTTGSGLGLGLAQRMIELLGGKLAIASTHGKGTLVHVEIPIHLLNDDNDSDQDIMASNDAEASTGTAESVRQDGIFLIGWTESKDPTIRRVGKALVRQLKLNFCRVVSEINYASLIVVPEGTVKENKLAELCRMARPGVSIVVLGKDQSIGALAPMLGPASASEHDTLMAQSRSTSNPENTGQGYGRKRSASTTESAHAFLQTIPTIWLTRPLRPSVLKRIMQPAQDMPQFREVYKSDVVGGDAAREEAAAVALADSLQNASNAKKAPVHPDAPQDITSSDAEDITHTFRLPKMEPRSEEEITSAESTSEQTPGTTTESSMTSDMGLGSHLSMASSDASVSAASDSGESGMRGLTLREMRSGSEHTVRAAQTADGDPLKGEQLFDLRFFAFLVVEDNAVNRKILTTMLKRTSCKFVEAADGVEAVTQFNSFHPDLVLLDITMPRKDGFAAAAEMRHIEATLPADSAVPLEEVMKHLIMEDQATPTPGSVATMSLTPSTATSGPGLPPSASASADKSSSTIDTLSPSSSRPLSPTSPMSSHSGIGGSVSGSGSSSKRAKIIAVTAMSAEHQRRKGLIESGIDMWMVKPIAMRELRGIVERMKEEKAASVGGGGGNGGLGLRSGSEAGEMTTTGDRDGNERD